MKLKLTLRQRIYFSMITLIMLSFIVSGVTAYMNFKSQEEEYNRQRLGRKELAVQESMRYFLEQNGGRMSPDSVVHHFEDKVGELSDVHRLAINLYNLRGDLLVSSSPSNLEQLGFSQKIDYTVMKQLSTGNTRAEQKRDIDYGTYVLAYWYFSDADGRPIAITNVRYDKQEIDNSELRDFLIRLTQIYIVLFIGASALAFLLSNYITSSLQKIGKRMQKVDLATHGERIDWRSNDEIGALVEAYNRMLDEVRASAAKLAKSERESAWREMAKQVAHEIKNPLTPMRLRVQHLQRSLNPKSPDFDEKLNAFCGSMIEQIDTLSTIAGEFSDFAKMPKAKVERVFLEELLKRCVGLYQENDQISIEVKIQSDEAESAVMGDKEQLLRVFNNLIMNGLQAVPEGRKAEISLVLSKVEKEVVVTVQDNGTGIPDEMHEQIFVPNFTTKSTGAGLGLAIVKSIVEQSGGSISFVTAENAGTTFTIRLPHTAPAD